MAHSHVKRAFLAVAALGFLAMGACTKDTITSDARDPFNPPPDSVNGFLGYGDVEARKTTCSNCHADQGVDWEITGHADAWEGLQASGHAQSFCEGCHAVSQQGNALTSAAGINALDTADVDGRARYEDVQCESCHGPGADHATNPSVTVPLASIQADTGLGDGCGDCHSGTHHPFVEQWAASAHGNVTGFASGRSGCDECHNGRVAMLAQFGENANYVEKDDSGPFDIVCATCHDPHAHDNDGQLRSPVDVGSARNLCIKCHNNRTVPTATTHGPHAAQGPLVLGANIGWWPDSLAWLDGLRGTHGNASVNERLCATCHVEFFTVTDPATGGFVFESVGHLFEAIPCLDSNGIPVPGSCPDTERAFSGCTGAGCHSTEAGALSLYESFQDDLTDYLLQIWTDVDGDHEIDVAPDTGLLVRIVAQEGMKALDVSDTLFTVAEGILWNAQLAYTDSASWFSDFVVIVSPIDTVHVGAHPTSGNGVHNPPFLEALMIASLAHGSSHYGVAPPAGVVLQLPPAAQAMRR